MHLCIIGRPTLGPNLKGLFKFIHNTLWLDAAIITELQLHQSVIETVAAVTDATAAALLVSTNIYNAQLSRMSHCAQ